MTKKEHEAAKELRKELKRRKSQGEDNLIIRRGKIVERKQPPSESSDVNMDALLHPCSGNLNILYTNADQFLNKREDLLMLITNNNPDLIIITEVIPKTQINPIPPQRLAKH